MMKRQEDFKMRKENKVLMVYLINLVL